MRRDLELHRVTTTGHTWQTSCAKWQNGSGLRGHTYSMFSGLPVRVHGLSNMPPLSGTQQRDTLLLSKRQLISVQRFYWELLWVHFNMWTTKWTQLWISCKIGATFRDLTDTSRVSNFLLANVRVGASSRRKILPECSEQLTWSYLDLTSRFQLNSWDLLTSFSNDYEWDRFKPILNLDRGLKRWPKHRVKHQYWWWHSCWK